MFLQRFLTKRDFCVRVLMMKKMFVQATAVSFQKGAVLIMGPAGSGKSTLALKLIEKGARLMADDGVMITARRGHLIATPPDAMRGCLEVRGIGIVSGLPVRRRARVRCVIQLTTDSAMRIPTPCYWTQDGVSVRLFYLNPSDPALDLKVLTAFRISVGKFSLFSELNVLKQTQIQFFKKRFK